MHFAVVGDLGLSSIALFASLCYTDYQLFKLYCTICTPRNAGWISGAAALDDAMESNSVA